MPFVRALPSQYLLTGRDGSLVNRGSAVQTFLRPGTIWVVVPATKQEAAFEFTQETKDGIPLRFKGIVVYRVADPVAAAKAFDFTGGDAPGLQRINALLTHVCLGELRHAVSHMTMTECVEQRKTTLTGVVRAAVDAIAGGDGATGTWGIEVEVAQVAQVFIVDAELRGRLEAEARNEIRLRSEQSDIRTAEQTRLAAMISDNRVAEQSLARDREDLRRREELFASELAARDARGAAETPVHLLELARQREVLEQELAVQGLRNQLEADVVDHDLQRPRAEQALRREILPLEQAPQLVESAARVLQGSTLSIYGDGADLLGHLAPLFELLARTVHQAMPAFGAVAADGPAEDGRS